MNLSKKIFIGYMFFQILLTTPIAYGQSFRYLTKNTGLSSNRIYSITKDKEGYMWFLTSNGIDRYNGKDFKSYYPETILSNPNFPLSQDELVIDESGMLWYIRKNGLVYKYNQTKDKFDTIKVFRDRGFPQKITYTYLGPNNTIWLCNKDTIYLYETNLNFYKKIVKSNSYSITDIQPIKNNLFYIGTEHGLFLAQLTNNTLKTIHCQTTDTISTRIQKLHYNPLHQKLLIGTLHKGVYIYDIKANQIKNTGIPHNLQITKFAAYGTNQQNILIATFGAGIYKYNLIEDKLESFLTADYTNENKMNGNNINEIYVDEKQRIWASVYPISITTYRHSYPSYNWIRHAINNTQTIINNQINHIIQDSEGDIWFATNNGISLYRKKEKKWEHYLSDIQTDTPNGSHIYLTLCEIQPGIIMTGGYMSGLYRIDKKQKKVHIISPLHNEKDTNKYIRTIIKDKNGYIWIGSCNNIKRIDWKNQKCQDFKINYQVTCMMEKDGNDIWIGTTGGLYKINKRSGKITTINLPIRCTYISAIYQDKYANLYIGTCGNGLLIYNQRTDKYATYYQNNKLISNNIYAITSDADGNILFSTEEGLTRYIHQTRTFSNWTTEQGLIPTNFNYNACLHTKENTFIFGSNNGAIEFSDKTHFPYENEEKIVFSNFQTIPKKNLYLPEEKPISIDINKRTEIKLPYSQNIFSFRISSINYDNSENILYSWKTEGFHNKWNTPSKNNIIQYANLNPGQYILRVRAILESNLTILDEKAITINIEPPFWATAWGKMILLSILILIGFIIIRYYWIKREKKLTADKMEFYINMAHDIRTPLTLIKIPLEELNKEKEISEKGKQHLNLALHKTNELSEVISNALTYEKSIYESETLHIKKYNINSLIKKNIDYFTPYANSRNLLLEFIPDENISEVWIDKDKINSILQNLLSNALKYTCENGKVKLSTLLENDKWGIRIQDTGIGIPEKEQKNLFNPFFRASNAIHIKDSAGIGLNMVQKLVKIHKGNILFESTEKKGSTFTVLFPIGYKYYKQEFIDFSDEHYKEQTIQTVINEEKENALTETSGKKYRIVIVEDNKEMRSFLESLLSATYTVFTAENGVKGWESIIKTDPDLIISDIMMPELSGNKLCKKLKENIETSHIPIILLTALGETEHVVHGLNNLADSYITKPFNKDVLYATIKTLIQNRNILKERFAKFSFYEDISNISGNTSNVDILFMKKVKEIIEINLASPNFTVDSLAASLNMSRSSFFKKLKNLTDQAPNTIIRNVRLNTAAELLWSKQHTVAEVSDITGFNDVKYFRKLFKKRFGCTPNEYAKKGANQKCQTANNSSIL